MRFATGAGAWLGSAVAAVTQAAGPLWPTAVVTAKTRGGSPSGRVQFSANTVNTLVINYRNQGGGVVSEVLIFDGSLVKEGRSTYLAEAPAHQA